MDSREMIVRRIAKEFKDGEIVNLGIGMPTLVANYIPEKVQIILQSENGFLYLGPAPKDGVYDTDLVNAGNQFVTVLPGACFFDSATSFGIIRGGHVDVTVLGTLEVDQEGNIANYIIPGKMVSGMGGAMDLVVGAKKVIIATEHCDKKGNPKILKKCRLPLTAVAEADMIVTEMAVIERTRRGLVLKELSPGITVDDVIRNTEAELTISENLKEVSL
ncbi:MAG: 3-oxoacid CoA-transferase subunit B [Deltaproteobacteria bacterium]|nr:3-oxoacid CoA-transferase subunit B [Deltaproteobacteria bacterium]